MKQPISIERWMQAQEAEKKIHAEGERDIDYYFGVYNTYFKYVGVDMESSKERSILEVGPASVPALAYTHYTGFDLFVCEPNPSKRLIDICEFGGITILDSPLEHLPSLQFDEIWLFNVMQHIIDPELFVSKCKEMAGVIRYFEPIDEGTTVYHPHSYAFEDFYRWFGCKDIYEPSGEPNFHTAKCAYGIWTKRASA